MTFVSSVYHDTDLYRRYLVPGQLSEIPDLRKRMSEAFRIDRVDRSAFGPHEYYVVFDNGSTATIYLSEDDDEVKAVGIHMYQSEPRK